MVTVTVDTPCIMIHTPGLYNDGTFPNSKYCFSTTWVVSRNKRFRANIIVWGFSRDLSTLKIRAKLSGLGLSSFTAGKVAWEGDHVRLVLTPKDSKGLTKELVSQVSAHLRKIGCRCVLDEALRDHSRCAKPARVECVNSWTNVIAW